MGINLLHTHTSTYTDRSDELSCVHKHASTCDAASQFRCNNGQCISAQFRCLLTADRRQMCADGSNLHNCANWTCQQSEQIKCAGSYCVSAELKCNEKLDCPVLSSWDDEKFCRKSNFHLFICLLPF